MNPYNPLYQQYQDRTLFVASFNLSPQQLGHITSDAPNLTALEIHKLYVKTRQNLAIVNQVQKAAINCENPQKPVLLSALSK